MNNNIKPDKSWTLFLDRDGIINERPFNDYVKSVEEFVFIDGVLESLNKLSKLFGKIIIVTNQQGVGKKLMTEKDLNGIHEFMCEKIRRAGGRIDKIYYCPDLDGSGSKDRKPETGMGLKAKQDFPGIDFKKSIVVGDNLTDMVFGKKLNIFTVFISDDIDYISNEKNQIWDLHFRSLKEFCDSIIKSV